ncbi:MAG: acetate--CoA ligase [Promethearchaeota archaeon]
MNEIVWRSSGDYQTKSNIRRFMNTHNIKTYDELIRRSTEDIEWFWDAALKDIGVEWYQPYSKVLDDSKGIEWTKWFVGGKLNIVHNILDRHVQSPRANKTALIWVSETGEDRILTYAQLNEGVCKLANALKELGIGKGDPCAIYMPMVPETVMALLASYKIGAIGVPIFSGFSPDAVKMRIQDVGAKILFTADGSTRRGKQVPLKKNADSSIDGVKSIKHMIVFSRLGLKITWNKGVDLWWHDTIEGMNHSAPTTQMSSEDPAMVLYSSGTTGKPKGTVHSHAGALAQAAKEVTYYCDVKESDTLFWLSDLGWMMGPWQIVGAQHQGAAHLIYEGAIDYPKPDQLWKIIDTYKVTAFGISPTAIRYLIRLGDEWVNKHEMSTLRILGSTGEPWDDTSWLWYFNTVGRGKLPIINLSGGTEIFGCFLSPMPINDLKPRTLRGPGLGMDIDCVDDTGKSVRGDIGTLICRKPAPSMTRGFWNAPERYIETYWSTFPGIWWHGDLAQVDEDGFWFLLGRADDVIKVSSQRVGPSEIETALISHKAVSEVAAIGVPHEIKGTGIIAYVVLKSGFEISEDLREELRQFIGKKMGKPFLPEEVRFVSALPKTRSGKIVRRLIKRVYLGQAVGDLSSVENPEAFDSIRDSK